MQTPFELNLQKLSLEALHDERERNRQRDLDIENEILARRKQAAADTVAKFVADMKSHGFSSKDLLAAVKDAFGADTPQAEAPAKPRRARAAAKTAPRVKGAGPRIGVTYVNPDDASQTWTKQAALGAPARWLSRLVADSGKRYEDFEKKN